MSTVEPSAKERPASPRAAIIQSNARLQEAVARHDAAAITALYTEEAQLMPPNAAAVQGRSDIQAFWAEIASGIKSLRIETQEVETSGDVAVETGRYQLHMQPAGSPEFRDEGKYMTVWHRQADGAWRLHRDIYNSNLPAPSMH